MEGAKRKLSLNLSFLNITDFTKQSCTRKSPRNFEGPVGLGILAAENDHGDPDLSRKGLVAISPKSASNAIPIIGKGGKVGFWDEVDSREEYTCVISHVGDDLIEKREYFGCVSAKNVLVSNGDSLNGSSGSAGGVMVSGFLNSCFLCKKMLQGLDIFMYRGDMAFCSPECRDKHISIEKKEKYQSRLRKQEYSVSPCSDSQSFSSEVIAA